MWPLAALDGGVAGVEVAAQDLRERIGSLPCRGAFFGGVLDRLPGLVNAESAVRSIRR